MVSMKKNVLKKIKQEKTQNSVKLTKVKKVKSKKNSLNEASIKKSEEIIVNQDAVKVFKGKRKGKYLMPSKAVTEELVNSCLNALQKLAAHHKKKNNNIFEDEIPVFAEIMCIKIPKTTVNIKFVYPHSTYPSTGEVCLITPDIKKGRRVDHEPTVDRWEDILRQAGVTSVKTVLPLRQLKVEYDQYELKRRLLTQHDFIMVDTRVLSHTSHLLGKMFFKKHNMLIPVRINEKENLKKQIDVGLHTAILRTSEGTTSSIILGHTGMSQTMLKENIMALVEQIRTKYPGGEANIRSIFVKIPNSLLLPLYITLKPSNTVNVPKITIKRPKHYTEVEGELSTMPGRKVIVAPDGTVRVKEIKETEDSDEDDNEEEELNEELAESD